MLNKQKLKSAPFKSISLISCALLLSACQTTSEPTPAAVQQTVSSEETNVNKQNSNKSIQQSRNESSTEMAKEKQQAPKIDTARDASPAVMSLLSQAQQQQKSGNNLAAISTLQRAIRLSPRFPESYYQLGEVYFNEGDYIQSNALAQKAISLGATGKIRQQALKLISNSAR